MICVWSLSLIHICSDKQAEGMKIIADSCPTAASVSLMDLSLEAEAFGSTIRVSDDEVPTVIVTLAVAIWSAVVPITYKLGVRTRSVSYTHLSQYSF